MKNIQNKTPLVPGKLYKIDNLKIENVMRSCNGYDQKFMRENINSPLYLLSDSTKLSERTQRLYDSYKEYLIDKEAITTIFLVKNKTVEFRTYENYIIGTNTRGMFLESLILLK